MTLVNKMNTYDDMRIKERRIFLTRWKPEPKRNYHYHQTNNSSNKVEHVSALALGNTRKCWLWELVNLVPGSLLGAPHALEKRALARLVNVSPSEIIPLGRGGETSNSRVFKWAFSIAWNARINCTYGGWWPPKFEFCILIFTFRCCPNALCLWH